MHHGPLIINKGSIGTNFYIIIQGSVSIHIKSSGKDEHGDDIVRLQKVGEFHTGSSFGELAIMEDVLKPRSATVICMTNCHFALLERKKYKKILGDAQNRIYKSHIKFLSEMSIFKGFTYHNLKSWVYLFEEKMVHAWRHVVYKEGQDSDQVYLIRVRPG